MGIKKADAMVKGSLVDKYIVPPFSVLDTKQKYWQDRRKKWLSIMGNLSETREAVLSNNLETDLMYKIKDGASSFDPVLSEVMMNWYCPKEGKIFDPFSGSSSGGVVAGNIGLTYYGCEFRQEQVDVNIEATKNL